jgi:hypothetical protein
MCGLISVDLVSKGPEETVSISYYISQFYLHRFDLSVEIGIVLQIDMAELESVSFSLLLPQFSFLFSIGFAL